MMLSYLGTFIFELLVCVANHGKSLDISNSSREISFGAVSCSSHLDSSRRTRTTGIVMTMNERRGDIDRNL